MRIFLFTLLIAFLVLRETSTHQCYLYIHNAFNNELANSYEAYRSELRALFGPLKSTVENSYNKQKVEQSLAASKLCSDQIAIATAKSKSLDSSVQSNIDQLEKKLQDTVDQLLHINKTCKCRTASMENFQKIGNKFYRFENKLKLNWFAAYKRCQKLGAHLSSLQEQDELEKLRGNLNEIDYWLGISDLATPGEYRVATTEQRASLLIWDAGEPQIDGESHCVTLQPDGSDYAMGARSCRLRLNFICEKVVFEEPK